MKNFKTTIPFALLAAAVVILAAATFIERSAGSDFVSENIYGSWWFASLWAVMFISAVVLLVSKHLHRNLPMFLLHCSFGVILAGAALTSVTSHKGFIHLREGESKTVYHSEDRNGGFLQLPFTVKLNDFKVVYYGGTDAPADYASNVEIIDGGKRRVSWVSMNNILRYRGYRFYQSSFDGDMEGAVLSVNYDPWGTPITYAGYILLAISMLWTLLSKKCGFRRLLKHPLIRGGAAAAVMLFTAGTAGAATPTISGEAAEEFGKLQISYGDRIAPVQTFARDFTLKLYGKPSYGGLSPVQVLAGWIFFPEEWQHEPIIRVKEADAQAALGVAEYTSFAGFFNPDKSYKIAPYVDRFHRGAGGDKSVAALEKADEKIQLVVMIQSGELLKLFPSHGGREWYSPVDSLSGVERQDSLFIRGIFPLLYPPVKGGNDGEVLELLKKISTYQKERGGENLRPDMSIKAEIFYNKADTATKLYRINLLFGLAAFGYFCWRVLKERKKRWIEALFFVQMIHSFAFITVNLALRSYACGRLPFSNGYETMMFAAWCVMLITLLFRKRFMLATAAGFLLSGFILLVSSLGSMNPQITSLVPVLSSSWLSIHVSLIMVSYALLGFVAINGVMAIALNLISTPNVSRVKIQTERLMLISKLLLYPALFTLAAGIFSGAVWANISWGRYWGWDPKEVWALITMLVYSFAMHGRSVRFIDDPVNFHCFAVVAFSTVLMTYFGVNHLFGGMHSYGSDTASQAVVIALSAGAGAIIACISSSMYIKRKNR